MAKTKFPTDMLELIPVGTGFSRRSGQATVNVTRISEDSLEVTAACDSLWLQIWIGRTAVAALLLGILRRRFINP